MDYETQSIYIALCLHWFIYIYIYIRMAIRSSIVVIYILGGFNVFGVMYINLKPKVLAAVSEF